MSLREPNLADFDRFAEPIAGESPCGPDCEYESDFLALSQEVAGKPEQQFGDAVIPAVEPDWRKVDSLAQELLGRTRDLRVVAWLTLANTHLSGIESFAAGLKLVRMLCENFWDDVHPRIEVDGESDPYLRMTAISAFAGSEFSGEDRILRALRSSVLLPAPLSAVFREVEATYTNAVDAAYSTAQLEPAIADAVGANDAKLAAVLAAADDLAALRSLISDRVSAADAPDIERLETTLKPVAQAITKIKASLSGAPGDVDASGEGTVAAGSTGVPGISGAVQSREDARRALERVCEYLERHEPSNPASLFARRAQRMLSMSFIEIMREMTPDAISHVEMLTGIKPEDSSS
jgi:type VI secretion system protein ImpA